VKVRGRFWFGVWLVVLLVVAGAVVARQRSAIGVAGELNLLRTERLSLEAQSAEFARRIREGSSRTVLVPKVESRLGLRLPRDQELVTLRLNALPDSGS
jgi:hypothetical protein